MCNEYNGYSNYQTWNVALWLDNDEGSYQHIRTMTNTLNLQVEDKSWEFADWLKGFVEEYNPLDNKASMFSDLLGHALANVNYQEIAENILSE